MASEKAERARWARFREQAEPQLRSKWRDLFDPDGKLHQAGSRFRGPCPIHGGDGDAFTADSAKLTWSCHSGCDPSPGQDAAGGGPIEFLVRRDGLTREQARDRLAELVGVDLDRDTRPGALTVADADRALDDWAQKRDLDPGMLRTVWSCTPTVRRGKQGETWVDRPAMDFPTPAGLTPRIRYLDGLQPKTGWPSQKERAKHQGWGPGKGSWYGLEQARPMLPSTGWILYLVNGEPSVWAAHQSGVPAVCTCMGEKSGLPPTGPLVAALASHKARVGVVYDNDEAGREGAAATVRNLRKAGLEAVALQLPDDLGEHGDVDDLHRRVGDEGLADALAALPEIEIQEETPTATKTPPAGSHRIEPSLECDESMLGYALTDLGNAERLRAYAGHYLAYNPAAGWRVWNGQRWALDVGRQVDRWGQETIRLIPVQAAAALSDKKLDTAAYGDLLAFAAESEKASRLNAMVSLAATHSYRPEADFDADPMLLNVRNGTLDLRNGTLRPHDRADFLTRIAPVDFDPKATCPRWEQFTVEVFPDLGLRAFVQRAIGYALTGSTAEQVFFLGQGAGSNGKDVLAEIISAMLGKGGDGYACAADFSSFLADPSRSGGSPRPDLVRLVGQRFVYSAEPDEGAKWSDGLLKQVTGESPLTARQLHKSSFEFMPSFKLWFSCNNLPRSRDTSAGFWRRVRLIPFTETFSGARRDPNLKQKLRAELSGILNWALAGLRAWQAEGLGTCAAVEARGAAYRLDSDPIGRWLVECCVVRQGCEATNEQLRRSLDEWSKDEAGGYPPSPKMLGKRLAALGCEKFKRGGVRGWKGVGLLADEEQGAVGLGHMDTWGTCNPGFSIFPGEREKTPVTPAPSVQVSLVDPLADDDEADDPEVIFEILPDDDDGIDFEILPDAPMEVPSCSA